MEHVADPPILYAVEQECCGCSACYAICPKRAIVMKADDEGFLYPYINDSMCIRCGRCLKVCAFKKDQNKKWQVEPKGAGK